MVKQVEKTEKIHALITKSVGDEVNVDNLAVYEAVFATTDPLVRRKSGLFASARIGTDMLAAMSNVVKSGEHIPLQTMHEDGIPKGKVFSAELAPTPNGGTKLQGLFYLPKDTEAELISKIDSGVVSEVSVGTRASQLLCSECGFDYMGDEVDLVNILDCTCAAGHQVGKNGVHVRMHGLDTWMELSLVDRGAVTGASILPRSRQQLGAPDPVKLAARGFDPRVLTLHAAVSETLPTTTKEPKNMDELVQAKVDLTLAERDRDAATAKVADLETKLAAATAKVAELETELTAAKATDAAALSSELEGVRGLVDELATAALAATGKTAEALPKTLTEKVAVFREARSALAVGLVAGGVSQPAATDDTRPEPQSFAAYTTRKS